MTGLWAECSAKNDRPSNTQPAIAPDNKRYSAEFCVKNAVDWNNWRRLQRRSDKPHITRSQQLRPTTNAIFLHSS
jgi:hypothetical protein